MLLRRTTFAATAGLLGGLIAAVPPSAAVPTGCGFDAGSRTVSIVLDGGDHVVAVGADHEIVLDGTLHCGAAVDDPRTTPLADQVTIGAISVNTLTLDLAGGAFAPGFTAEGTGVSEVEIEVNGFAATLVVSGSALDDDLRAGFGLGTAGVNLNGDDDADVSIDLPGHLVLRGNEGADHLGSAADGVALGLDLAATLDGGPGPDVLIGGTEADTLRPGPGDDEVTCGGFPAAPNPVQQPRDVLSYDQAGGPVTVDLGSGTATGAAGADTIAAGCGEVVGTAYDDDLLGSAADEVFVGGPGSDLVDGRGGTDFASYAAAPNPVRVDFEAGGATGQGTDSLDRIEGVVGSAGDDRVSPAGTLIFYGLGGSDLVDLSAATSPVVLSLSSTAPQKTPLGTVTLVDVEAVRGGSAADLLTGSDAANVLDGAGGEDRLAGLSGPDQLIGGSGRDVADYSGAPARVYAFLALGAAGGGAGEDSLVAIEDLIGSAYGDRLVGNSGANRLWGRAGDDNLRGLRGNDILAGEGGNDILAGGLGTDTCKGGPGTNLLTACE